MDHAIASKQSIEMVHSQGLIALRAEEQTSKQLAIDFALKVLHFFPFLELL